MQDTPPTILIVDDEHHIRHVVAWKLRNRGLDIVTASDGEEALELALEHPPDLVVSDYQMPVMDGLQLCTLLAEHDATRDIPVILLTGRGHRVDSMALAKTNIQQVMSKPFSPSDLLDRIGSVLGVDLDSPDSQHQSDAA